MSLATQYSTITESHLSKSENDFCVSIKTIGLAGNTISAKVLDSDRSRAKAIDCQGTCG